MKPISSIINKVHFYFIKGLCVLITAYRWFISPILGNHCRFHPSCSVYTEQALKNYGVFKGSWMAMCRLARCHPFHVGGDDPLPPPPR